MSSKRDPDEVLTVSFRSAPGEHPAPFWIRARRLLKAAARHYGLKASWPDPHAARRLEQDAHSNQDAQLSIHPTRNMPGGAKRASGQANGTGDEIEVF